MELSGRSRIAEFKNRDLSSELGDKMSGIAGFFESEKTQNLGEREGERTEEREEKEKKKKDESDSVCSLSVFFFGFLYCFSP